MKIKARQIKLGMVIGIFRGDLNTKGKKEWDACLVTAITRGDRVLYTHLDAHCNSGRMVGTIDAKEKVKVFLGSERKAIFNAIKRQVFKNLQYAEDEVNIIRLIEAMDKQNK